MTLLPTIASWTCVAVLFMAAQGLADDGRDKRDTMLKITTIEEPPYVTVKNKPPQSNADYEGYIPDLLSKIATKLNRKYTIHLVGDNHYGTKSEQGTWNGMIKEVIHDIADVAGAPITISKQREEVLDFTEPFMEFGTVILMKKPTDNTTVKIRSFKDLSDQTDIKYGAVKDGSTLQLLGSSSDQTYKKLHEQMMKDPTLLVDTSNEGVTKVRDDKHGKYAIIVEAGTGDYWVQKKPCDLVAVNSDAEIRRYALAVKKGSDLKNQLNTIILDLKKSGELKELKNKWWPSECSGTRINYTSALSMAAAILLATILHKN